MLRSIQQVYLQFQKGIKIINELDQSFLNFKLENINLIGMGGSALMGDLLNDTVCQNFPIRIINDYHLGKKDFDHDLVFCCSYSGNTEETLSSLEEALNKKAFVVVLTHGGKLKEGALFQKIPLIEIPTCIQPRMAAGYFFSGIISILEKKGVIESQKENLEHLATFLKIQQKRQEEIGKELADHLKDKVPIIYGPTNFYGTCRNIKIKFNENCKIQSFFNVFPELNHNEMVGWTRLLMPAAFIYLKSQFMHPRIGRRMEIMEELLKNKIPFFSVELKGKDHLQEVWDAVLIGDYASYYLAKAYGIDPAPVEMVEEFKKKL